MHLRQATDEEKRTRDGLTFQAWGPPLDLPGYLAREHVLSSNRLIEVVLETLGASGREPGWGS